MNEQSSLPSLGGEGQWLRAKLGCKGSFSLSCGLSVPSCRSLLPRVRENQSRSACLCGLSPGSGENAAPGSLCASVKGAEGRGRVRQIVSSDGTAGQPDCKVLEGLKPADPSPPRIHRVPLPPCAAPGLRAPPAGRPGCPTAAAAGRAAGGGHARPSRRRPCRGARGRGELRRAGKPTSGQRCLVPGGCASSALPRRGGGRSRGLSGARALRAGPLLRGTSPGAGPRSSSPGSACPRIRRPGELEGEGGKEGGGAGARHSGHTHPAPPLERAEVLEPLPQAVRPRQAPAAALPPCGPVLSPATFG